MKTMKFIFIIIFYILIFVNVSYSNFDANDYVISKNSTIVNNPSINKKFNLEIYSGYNYGNYFFQYFFKDVLNIIDKEDYIYSVDNEASYYYDFDYKKNKYFTRKINQVVFFYNASEKISIGFNFKYFKLNNYANISTSYSYFDISNNYHYYHIFYYIYYSLKIFSYDFLLQYNLFKISNFNFSLVFNYEVNNIILKYKKIYNYYSSDDFSWFEIYEKSIDKKIKNYFGYSYGIKVAYNVPEKNNYISLEISKWDLLIDNSYCDFYYNIFIGIGQKF